MAASGRVVKSMGNLMAVFHLFLLLLLVFESIFIVQIDATQLSDNNNVEKSDLNTRSRADLPKNVASGARSRSARSDFKNDDHPPPPVPVISKPGIMKLAEQPECKDDIRRLCEAYRSNNFAVLDCIQAEKDPEDIGLTPECNHLLWDYKKNLTQDDRFSDAAKAVCSNEFSKFPECHPDVDAPGHVLACFMDLKENMSNAQCKQFLTKMESIVFSDYRLIHKFVDKCKGDIKVAKCGRLGDASEKLHSQGDTIECLQKRTSELAEECRHEIFRISELQSDDFHLDRPLYFACRESREKLCNDIIAGEGRIYKCLIQHKLDPDMAYDCRDKLSQRQKLISQDYKVSRGLSKACREDIKHYRCRDDTSKNRVIRLSQILICLENSLHKELPVSKDCQAEMLEHRKSVMEDYEISPDLVTACGNDISQLCNSRVEGNGKTIHCLMEHSKPTTRRKNRISEPCKRELEKLLREADAAEDWRVDPALKEACQKVVNVACTDIRPGDARVLSCLMDKIESDHMTDDCQEKLLQIQYFVARDFRLDTRLYRSCRKDAKSLCGAPENWADDVAKMGPERGPLLPCLFRYAYHPTESMQLATSCLQEVKRVMRQRAISVDLHPEILEPCLNDLAEICKDKRAKGEELVCLQDNLEKLSPVCRTAVSNYTEEEAEHAELNSVLYKACEAPARRYCEDVMKKDVDEGDMMQCLIEHRNEYDIKVNHKCRAAVDHFMLVSLKDYRFSFKFKEACKKEVMQQCKNVHTKAEVVQCLSERVRNDTILERPQRVGKDCRQQLRVELLQRNEDFNLDPVLAEACKQDIGKYCKTASPGNAMMLECLKNNRRWLLPSCHRKVFNREQEEMIDNSIDHSLMTACKRMIKLFCVDADIADSLNCLKDYKDNAEFDVKCRAVVLQRMAQQNSDYRLNPQLRKACALDMPKFCKKILNNEPPDGAFEGKVIDCLKDKFRTHQLTNDCGFQVSRIIRESQMHYQQDAVLSDLCKNEIDQLCNEDDGKGKVEECLKLKFQAGAITADACKKQIAKLLQQGRADIHADPLLYKACALDVKHFCVNIPPGEGRQLSCLIEILSSNKGIQLRPECKAMLSRRVEMFDSAMKAAPLETVQELYEQVSHSPARNYFIVITFALIGMIFFGGLFCGRVTKRVRSELKNK